MSKSKNLTQMALAARADARLAAIVESSFDAIVGKDLNGIITDWNGAAERLFGYSPDEAIGNSILMLIPENRRDEEQEILSRIRNGERVESFETTGRRRDGTHIAVSLTISPIADENGVIVGASKIARDITATRRARSASVSCFVRSIIGLRTSTQ